MKIKAIHIFLLLLMAFSIGAHAQNDELFKLWPDSVIVDANSAKDVEYMSEEEKQAVFIINLIRINPGLFADTYFKEYLEEHSIKKDKEIKSLISELKDLDDMVILKPNKTLTEAARKHAIDMGETGRTGHNSSDGTFFRDRMEPLSNVFDGVNENCNYGNELGEDAVIDLLIDRNVPNFGHRRNILDPDMQHIGIAIEPHKRWGYNCVQDFGGKKKGETTN